MRGWEPFHRLRGSHPVLSLEGLGPGRVPDDPVVGGRSGTVTSAMPSTDVPVGYFRTPMARMISCLTEPPLSSEAEARTDM